MKRDREWHNALLTMRSGTNWSLRRFFDEQRNFKKRERGRELPPCSRNRLLVSASPVCGIAIRHYTFTGFPVAMLLASA